MTRCSFPILASIIIGLFLFGPVQRTFSQQKNTLKDSVQFFLAKRQGHKAFLYAKQWSDKVKVEVGEESEEYAGSLDTLGLCYFYKDRDGVEAEAAIREALRLRKKIFGEEHLNIAKSYSVLGLIFEWHYEYKRADSVLLLSLKIKQKVLGIEHPEVAKDLMDLGIVNIWIDRKKAESYALRSLEITKKIFGEESFEVCKAYFSMSMIYGRTHRIDKDIECLERALIIREKFRTREQPGLKSILNNLAGSYSQRGDYLKAEAYQLKILDLNTKDPDEFYPPSAYDYSSLAETYSDLGLVTKAEEYYKKRLDFETKAKGEKNDGLAYTYSCIGDIYFEKNDYKSANYYYQISRNLIMGKNSGSYSSLPKYLEWRIGNFFAAEKLLLESFERRKTNRRAVFGFTSGSLDLGRFYSDVGNFSNSEYHILESLKHLSKFSDTGSPIMVEHIYHLGLLYTRMGNYAKAERPFLDYWKQINGQIQKLFPYLSDGEKALNFDKYRTSLEELKAYSLLRYKTKPEITSHLYNQQLATKSLLLNSSAKWKHRIKTSGDKKLFLLFTEWEASQITLGKLLISTDSTTRAGIDSVQKKTDKMERELSQRSENFARLTDNRQTDWKDIQATLKPGDAAIEIIRIQKYGIARTVTDSSDPKKTIYRIKGLTDTVHYAALIVKPGLKFPEMVSLANGNEMEGKDILYYKNCIQNKISDEYSYKTFWKKIGDKLGPKIKRVYFSPDGIYHSINMSTLFNPQTHKFLLEEKEIRLLTVTKDLILPRKEEEMNRLASLVGHPNFNGNTFQGLNKQDQERKSPTSSYFLTLSRGETVSELPGTKTEVENISDFLQKKGWEVQTLMGDNALEENIKEAYKPRILHLATHGFFQPDTTMGNNPLFHSGLLLSGANKTFAGEKSDEAEDGILTAYEAMNLNLDNTDLVVLSACETGLGEIKNGEGVYGLQRAFKVAGAKSIIMSLWKVSDQATQELMVSFYKHWLNSPLNPPKGDLKTPNRKISGNTETESPLRGLGAGTKRASFLKAQKELKTKYPEPFYWGAFVMVGE